MKKLIAAVLSMVPALGFADAKRVTDYKTASCTLYKDDAVLHEQADIKLMTLSIEDHLGRFTQQVWSDGEKTIQYQLLVEDDVSSTATDTFVVLQNLKVADHEVSAEFSAKDVKSVQISNEEYKVRCALPHD